LRKTQRNRLKREDELQLKTLLREYFEDRGQATTPRYDFLPNFKRDVNLPIEPTEVSWSRTNESERSLRFTRRSDLQDFVNAYLELEEEQGLYAKLTVSGLEIRISSETSLERKFKEMIDEIAHETRGY
jgi:hypothetical protein